MINKFLAGILLSYIALSAAGCSQAPGPEMPPESLIETTAPLEAERGECAENGYEQLIADTKERIINWDGNSPLEDKFSIALLTSASYGGVSGYLIKDIDGDGTDELLFGVNVDEEADLWNGVIYDVYTISDGAIVHVISGGERNRYYLCENGMVANEGSGGAANSSYAYFTFNGEKLSLTEAVIYDGMRDGDNPWFYSTESEYDAENAASISEEKAEEIQKKYVYEHLVFTPFAESE